MFKRLLETLDIGRERFWSFLGGLHSGNTSFQAKQLKPVLEVQQAVSKTFWKKSQHLVREGQEMTKPAFQESCGGRVENSTLASFKTSFNRGLGQIFRKV